MLLWFHFRIKNKRIIIDFTEKIMKLYTEIEIHKRQISRRTDDLNYYDFLKYNLREALVIQNQIRL